VKKPKVDSVENYYQRFEFPGGVRLYPLGALDQLSPLRQVNTRHGGTIKTKGATGIKFESRGEKKEIFRMLKILKAESIKTQVLELITPTGKRFYPDVVAQLGDGTILVAEIKHVLDFLWFDVIEKYKTMIAYCKEKGYGCALTDGKWRDFRYLEQGGTIHFIKVVEWFEKVIQTKGFFTLKDLRKQFPEETYWPTLVSYCLLQGYHTQVSFRHPAWEIRVQQKR
jgi:hypothetical protein